MVDIPDLPDVGDVGPGWAVELNAAITDIASRDGDWIETQVPSGLYTVVTTELAANVSSRGTGWRVMAPADRLRLNVNEGPWSPPTGRYLPVTQSVEATPTLAMVLNRLYLTPWPVVGAGTADQIGLRATVNATAGGKVRVGVYEQVGPSELWIRADLGSQLVDSGSQNKLWDFLLDVDVSVLWVASVAQVAAPTVTAVSSLSVMAGSTAALNATGAGYSISNVTGALPSVVTLGTNPVSPVPLAWARYV